MKNEQEKITQFELAYPNEIIITHGYNISNTFPVHFHTTYNLGIIELGQREFTYRGKKTILQQNDVFIIQPFEPHSCKSIDNYGHSYKIISLNLSTSFYFPHLIIQKSGLLTIIRQFHNLAEYESTSSKIIDLLNEIKVQLKECGIIQCIDNLDDKFSSKINFARLFIEKNCQFDISLKEMADSACLSEFHFNRFFHQCYGLSPYAYYLVCKMKKSQKFLMKQKSSIETACDMGFFDQSHFIKQFKKYIGVTPGKYLKYNK